LPISVPKSAGQLPVYYNYKKPSRHDYVEMDAKPLYSFGYGLSYSKFDYSNLNVSVSETGSDVAVTVTLAVKNTGSRDGDEVVQLYVDDKASSVVGPLTQLKKFERLNLKAGEEKIVTFTLTTDDLKLLDPGMNWVVEKGDFTVLVGASSDDIRQKKDFTLTRDLVAKP
jgi:beta-glucosidase